MSRPTDDLTPWQLNHPDLGNAGFAHISNVSELEVETPYDLGNGLQIRMAHPNEAATLSHLLKLDYQSSGRHPQRNPYETVSRLDEVKPGSISYTHTDLPHDQWRHVVIASEGRNNRKRHGFVRASAQTLKRLQRGL
jgi:hypothetical protein